MHAIRFVRYTLRTVGLEAAKPFYDAVLGDDVWGPDVDAFELHEQARAKGARPHWLGSLGVGDFEPVADRFVALGAQRLGPTTKGATRSWATLRDPSGAIVALDTEKDAQVRDIVALHVLHTPDRARALAAYRELFGWKATAVVERPEGHYQGFTWRDDGAEVGLVSDAARSETIHPQWLFFFRVPNLEERLARVRALGGTSLAPVRSANGDVLVACDDPQGAAFGLFEAAAAPGSR